MRGTEWHKLNYAVTQSGFTHLFRLAEEILGKQSSNLNSNSHTYTHKKVYTNNKSLLHTMLTYLIKFKDAQSINKTHEGSGKVSFQN